MAVALAGVIAILAAREAEAARRNRSYEEKVAAHSAENASLKQGQTVFIGDSITEHYATAWAYRRLNTEVYNRGISGDTSDRLLTRLSESLFGAAPSRVVLMIGTNDIELGRSPEEIAAIYEQILRLIATQLPRAEVYCVSIIPQNTEHAEQAHEHNRQIRRTNERIEALTVAFGGSYVNLYDRLTDETGLLRRSYSPDGLHLNRRGYRVWTRTMKELWEE